VTKDPASNDDFRRLGFFSFKMAAVPCPLYAVMSEKDTKTAVTLLVTQK